MTGKPIIAVLIISLFIVCLLATGCSNNRHFKTKAADREDAERIRRESPNCNYIERHAHYTHQVERVEWH